MGQDRLGAQTIQCFGRVEFCVKKIETAANDSYITSTQVAQLLADIAAKYIGRPIAVILDNAGYQHCAYVKDRAVELGIRLIFLPTYSPNLNLIERVWKFVKAQVLNAAYIETFEEYRKRIAGFVEMIEKAHADRMAALVTEKFQLFDNCKAV